MRLAKDDGGKSVLPFRENDSHMSDSVPEDDAELEIGRERKKKLGHKELFPPG